jgi:hypothetical protein
VERKYSVSLGKHLKQENPELNKNSTGKLSARIQRQNGKSVPYSIITQGDVQFRVVCTHDAGEPLFSTMTISLCKNIPSHFQAMSINEMTVYFHMPPNYTASDVGAIFHVIKTSNNEKM